MEALGAFSTFISDDTVGPEYPEEMREAWTVQDGDTLLRPYTVLAFGPGWDEEGPYTAVVLVHETEVEATENAARFADRLASARMPVDPPPETVAGYFTSIEAEADGRVMTAVLRGFAIPAPPGGGLHTITPMWLHE